MHLEGMSMGLITQGFGMPILLKKLSGRLKLYFKAPSVSGNELRRRVGGYSCHSTRSVIH